VRCTYFLLLLSFCETTCVLSNGLRYHPRLAAFRKAPYAGTWLPGGVWVGSGVSEALAAFVARLAGTCR
jgi:hypothetical protein